MESDNEPPLVAWSAPQCPYAVEYAPGKLNDIRLAVMDAFFSLPRGGAEIGGVLLGSFRGSGVRIVDYLPLDCEHSTGPSFALSERDHARLAELLADAARGGPARQPVGWYHSHTRSDIFLSEADQEIHLRYFPQPWQSAMVLKPHTFQPMRAALFFREADGSMRGDAPSGEISLAALAVTPAPPAEPAAAERAPRAPVADRSRTPVVTLTPLAGNSRLEPQPERPVAAPPAEFSAEPANLDPTCERPPEDEALPIPKFLETPPKRNSFRAVLALSIVGVCLAAGGVAFQTRTLWLPRLAALYRHSEPAPPPLFLGLNAIDLAGQLQIRWDRTSPAVRQAAEGMIEILDGATPSANALDPAHLQTGVFTYARRTERVDVVLTAHMPDGSVVREATSFLGKPPEAGSAADNLELRKTQADFAKQAAKLKSDLGAQTRRTRTLEKSLADVQKQLREQQSRRMLNQDPGR